MQPTLAASLGVVFTPIHSLNKFVQVQRLRIWFNEIRETEEDSRKRRCRETPINLKDALPVNRLSNDILYSVIKR